MSVRYLKMVVIKLIEIEFYQLKYIKQVILSRSLPKTRSRLTYAAFFGTLLCSCVCITPQYMHISRQSDTQAERSNKVRNIKKKLIFLKKYIDKLW